MSDNNQVRIITSGQYIKNISFQNPLAPKIYTEKNASPKINVSIDINGKKINDTIFEVDLIVNVEAKLEDKDMFNINLDYAGIFNIQNIEDEERLKEILFIYCPSLLFPYTRRIVSDITRDASFPPLMIETIDFSKLYESKKETLKKI